MPSFNTRICALILGFTSQTMLTKAVAVGEWTGPRIGLLLVGYQRWPPTCHMATTDQIISTRHLQMLLTDIALIFWATPLIVWSAPNGSKHTETGEPPLVGCGSCLGSLEEEEESEFPLSGNPVWYLIIWEFFSRWGGRGPPNSKNLLSLT